MRQRTVFVGCLVGLIGSQLLLPVFKGFLPSYYGFEFTNQGPVLTQSAVLLLIGLSILLILAGGYVTARLEWAETWQKAAVAGLNAGLLAGCLAYMLSGASAAAGVIGQKEILSSLVNPVASEDAGISLLIAGVVNTAVWIQASFWVLIIPALLLGATGGLLSRLEKSPGWLTEPLAKKPELERLVVYSLGCFGIINLVICTIVMDIMPDAVQKSMLQYNTSSSALLVSPSFIMILPLVTAAAGLVPCMVLAIKWAIDGWSRPDERHRVKVWLWIVGLSNLALWFIQVRVAIPLIAAFAFIAFAIWAFREQTTPNPTKEAYQPYSALDFIASGVTQGVLSTTLTTATTIAYSLALVLIAIVDIKHLTLSGVVESTASEQISLLYTTQMSLNTILILTFSLIGLIIAGIGGATGILRSSSGKPVLSTDTLNVGND